MLSGGYLELLESPKGDVENESTDVVYLIHDQDVTLNF